MRACFVADDARWLSERKCMSLGTSLSARNLKRGMCHSDIDVLILWSGWWRRTLFMDEKWFCLDGIDGTACFWADERLLRATFSNRKRGGRCLIIWSGISWRAKTPLVLFKATMDAVAYTTMLDDTLMPFFEEFYPNAITFQQDSAPARWCAHSRSPHGGGIDENVLVAAHSVSELYRELLGTPIALFVWWCTSVLYLRWPPRSADLRMGQIVHGRD